MNKSIRFLTFCLCLMTCFDFATVTAWSFWPFSTEEVKPELQHADAWTKAVNFANHDLPHEGKLVRKSDGFVYLKVDDKYIHQLFPMLHLQNDEYKEPPYFRTYDSPGAHISVFLENEHVNPTEVGETFHFEIERIKIIHVGKKASYAILQVRSPELEKLRVKYGQPPLPLHHEFHISIAKKVNHRSYD